MKNIKNLMSNIKAILEEKKEGTTDITKAEIAVELGISPWTVQNYWRTLLNAGFIEVNPSYTKIIKGNKGEHAIRMALVKRGENKWRIKK